MVARQRPTKLVIDIRPVITGITKGHFYMVHPKHGPSRNFRICTHCEMWSRGYDHHAPTCPQRSN